MSFASEVKKELLSLEDTSNCCQKAVVLGVLQNIGDIVFSNGKIKIILKTHMRALLQLVVSTLKNEYNIETVVKYRDNDKLKKLRYYYLEILGDTKQIIDDFELSFFDEVNENINILKNNCCKNAFIRGMFISKGSINDPRKNCYHLEITCKNYELALLTKAILINNDIDAKIRNRKNSYVVYIKRSEEISSCLALMGAASGVFYFEDSRIVRDIANMANRMSNCDLANIKKTTDAANKQLKAIEYIRETKHFNKMPARLQTMAIMREEYPDSTLDELSEFSDNFFGKTLSKSGISHCLKALMDYYNNLIGRK